MLDYPNAIKVGKNSMKVNYKKVNGLSSSVRIHKAQVQISFSKFLIGKRRDKTVLKFLKWAEKRLSKVSDNTVLTPVYKDGGKIITLDHDEKIVRVANNFFKKGNLDNKIETIISPALETLKKFVQESKKFDLIFIDADKGNYKNYYELSLNLINKESLIIFDNVLWHGDVFKRTVTDKQTNIMREFNKYIKNDNRVEKIILPLGDGLTICRKV